MGVQGVRKCCDESVQSTGHVDNPVGGRLRVSQKYEAFSTFCTAMAFPFASC